MSKNNKIALLIIILYYLIINIILSGGLSIVVAFNYAQQLVAILIALSPIGEKLLRKIYGTRPIMTAKEISRIKPPFENVYLKVKKAFPSLNLDVSIFIDDSAKVNSYAIGRRTIVVTRGAIEAFSQRELEAIIAHEFGHIINGDTLFHLLMIVANFTFLILDTIFRLFEAIFIGIFNTGDIPGSKILFRIIRGLIIIVMWVYVGIQYLILLYNNRTNEYNADIFAHSLGYGNDLISALYILEEMSIGRKLALIEKIKSGHPDIHSRIASLEGVLRK